jgi:hypothetical protein
VILIMADDVGVEAFATYGGESYPTPNLDALAAAGTRFAQCHSQPLCTPSRVKLMTGQSNIRNYESFGILPRGEVTFAQVLQGAGSQYPQSQPSLFDTELVSSNAPLRGGSPAVWASIVVILIWSMLGTQSSTT